MRGVIMETKNGRAVLLTKGGDFVNIRNKGYSVGDKVNITLNTGRLCAIAASLFIVCAGIGSYFIPSGYVSVDINPSLMLTLNPYNTVIDAESFNDDARVLLDKTDIKGKSAEESVEILIKTSEEIGYINDNNRDVILEIVPGIIKPNMDKIHHSDIEITNETADKETLRISKDIGVSMAKVKALEEYTEKHGGDIRSNAAKFNDKSAKEMRTIMRDNVYSPDMSKPDIPSHMPIENTQKAQDTKEPPSKRSENQNYNTKNNASTADKPNAKEITKPSNSFKKDKYEPPAVSGENKSQNNPPSSESSHSNSTAAKPNIQQEQKPNKNIPPEHSSQTQSTQQEDIKKTPAGNKPIHTETPHSNPSDQGNNKPFDNAKPNEPSKNNNQTNADKQKPQDNTQSQGNYKFNDNIKPNEPSKNDNQTDNNGQNPEKKPPDNTQNQGNGNSGNKHAQPDGQSPDTTEPPDKQTKPEQKPDSNKPEKDTPQDNSHSSEPAAPREETPTQNTHASQDNIQPPNESPHESDSPKNTPPNRSEPGAQNGGDNRSSNKDKGSDNMHNEMQ